SRTGSPSYATLATRSSPSSSSPAKSAPSRTGAASCAHSANAAPGVGFSAQERNGPPRGRSLGTIPDRQTAGCPGHVEAPEPAGPAAKNEKAAGTRASAASGAP